MLTERHLTGRPAAPGFALGALVVLDGTPERRRASTGEPEREAAALRVAIAAALAEVSALMADAEGEAADILGFQVALLDDDALSEGAFAAITEGAAADAAWASAMAGEIAGYESAEDEYFRARAADLIDVRDRVLDHLSGRVGAAVPAGAVVVADDLPPSRFLAVDWSKGGAIALRAGSPSSHVAMLARAKGVPMVVGIEGLPAQGQTGEALVDGASGVVILAPAPATRDAFARRVSDAANEEASAERLRFLPAVTRSGAPVKVMLNIADPAELDGLDPAQCDGIGLVRTELLFHHDTGLPNEATQLDVYRRIVRWGAGRPITIRTLDAGGDKPIPGLTIDGETNPFLGVRGIRLSLARPDVFRVQLRALARAATEGPLKIMLPMVAVPAELEAARALLDAVIADLAREGLAHRRPALGIMVEVPAVAVTAERFDADFYSIGSNDLTQYTLAAARDITAVAHLADAGDPSVIALIAMTVAAADRRGVEVSLCGDAGADPAIVPKLLGAGLRSVSVSPRAVARVKAAIAAWPAAAT
jgi:phosphotransferase system enzyme I (PtsI)